MEPVIIDPDIEMENEWVLIKMSQHRVPYQDARRTDDYDVSLILSYDSCGIGKSEKLKDLLIGKIAKKEKPNHPTRRSG